jgi:tRNA pseudouridine-54 N-methylase
MSKFDIVFRSIVVVFFGFILYQQYEIKEIAQQAAGMADMAAQASNSTMFNVEELKFEVEQYMTLVSQEEATKIVEEENFSILVIYKRKIKLMLQKLQHLLLLLE